MRILNVELHEPAKTSLMRTVRILISFLIAGALAFGAVLDYGLWVLPPIGQTRDESIQLLRAGIIDKAIWYAVLGLVVVGIVSAFNWLLQSKIEKKVRRKEIALIAITSLIVIAIGIGVGMSDTYGGLLVEIDQKFN